MARIFSNARSRSPIMRLNMPPRPIDFAVTVYFDNCLGSCKLATMDLPDSMEISAVIDKCRERWGEGELVRTRGAASDLYWRKISERDGDWRGCCAEKIAAGQGNRTPSPD